MQKNREDDADGRSTKVRRDVVGTEPIAHTDILRLDLEKAPRRVLYLNSIFYLETHGLTRESNLAQGLVVHDLTNRNRMI
jgi:hypothetical protein